MLKMPIIIRRYGGTRAKVFRLFSRRYLCHSGSFMSDGELRAEFISRGM